MTLSEGERGAVRLAVRIAADQFDPAGPVEQGYVRRLRDLTTGFALGVLWKARGDVDIDPEEIREVEGVVREEVSVLRRAVEREARKTTDSGGA